jgi:phosphate-selective porin OprO/OprP
MTPDANAVADGDRWRLSPQLYWYLGPVGLMAEYVMSSQRVTRMGNSANIDNRAWNITVSFVLTMERASYEGVEPKHPVDFRHWSFGAWELVARYSELRIDDNAFPVFADPAASVRGARELAGGLNWALTHHTKVMFMYERTDFTGGAPNDANKKSENGLLGRIQMSI